MSRRVNILCNHLAGASKAFQDVNEDAVDLRAQSLFGVLGKVVCVFFLSEMAEITDIEYVPHRWLWSQEVPKVLA